MSLPAISFLALISDYSLNDDLCVRQSAAIFND